MSLVGCLLQFNMKYNTSENLLFSKGATFYDNRYQFIYSAASATFLTVSDFLLSKTRIYIHHSIDTIYVALSLTLVMPSFILGDYSVHPAKYLITWNEVIYYSVGGILTCLFKS